mgnify:CR=1 FL=1
MRTPALLLCFAACSPDAVITVDDEGAAATALSAPARLDWSGFPDRLQCLAAIQRFYPARFNARVPLARSAWTGSCAPDGACHLWLDDLPDPSVWERISYGSGRKPGAYDLVVYPPSGTNPWGHVASVDHVDDAGNVFVMDANFNGDERRALSPHTVARAPYGWYHLRALGGGGTPDFDGDGCADLWGRTAGGQLSLYSGDCGAGFRREDRRIGSGWSGLDSISHVGDFDGDGCADLIARRPGGDLLRYSGTCTGSLRDAAVIGTSWHSLSLITAAGDLNGDGCGDVIARAPDARLLLFPGNCRGGFASEAVVIGTGWSSLNALLGGDFSGDGCGDVLARHGDGRLLLFAGDCAAHLSEAVPAGHGWGPFDALLARDWNADGCTDVVARLPDGTLRLYQNRCPGLDDGAVIGAGFDAFTSLH